MKKIFNLCLAIVASIAANAQNSIQNIITDNISKYSIFENATSQLNYNVYLNQNLMECIGIIPSDNQTLEFIDPVSYGQSTSQLWEFYLDSSRGASQRLCANVYECEFVDGKWVKGENLLKNVTGGANSGMIKNRIEFFLNNSIIMEPYNPTKKYYRTKANSFVRIENNGGAYNISGSLQTTTKSPIKADMEKKDNGTAFLVDSPVMTTYQSVAKTLADNPDFSEFLVILQACDALYVQNSKDGWRSGDQLYGNLLNIKQKGSVGAEDASTSKITYLLNDYHYTIYAPTNSAMQMAHASGLPSIEDLIAAEQQDDDNNIDINDPNSSVAKIKQVMLDFVRYHIQDNSIFVDNGFESGKYNSGKLHFFPSIDIGENVPEDNLSNYNYDKDRVTKNEDGTYNIFYYPGNYTPGRPYKLNVNVNSQSMTVQDALGNVRKVITKDGYYNLMANEYWYSSSSDITQPCTVALNNMSSVVIHAIDGPLMYSSDQFTYQYKPQAIEQ